MTPSSRGIAALWEHIVSVCCRAGDTAKQLPTGPSGRKEDELIPARLNVAPSSLRKKPAGCSPSWGENGLEQSLQWLSDCGARTRTHMEFVVYPIGYVRSSLTDLSQCPHQGKEGAPEAWIELEPAYGEGLMGMEPGAEIIVLTWMHLADRTTLQVHPQRNLEKPMKGVFGTRSPDRPNPIALHKVTILEMDPPFRLLVKPLEALDRTPVIDLKISLPDDI